MPRKPRLNVPGAVYHVMSRCLDHYALFADDDDRERFLALLQLYISRQEALCYAWVLMRNHYHLVLRLGDTALGAFMKPLNMHYAHHHRKKYGRRGPLFMDRYKSIATQDQNYIQELVRYVHLNPLRAGICKTLGELNRYPWSGHAALVGSGGKHRAFQQTGSVLRRFGTTRADARRNYLKFLEDGLGNGDEDDQLVHLVRRSNEGIQAGRAPTCWVIGDREYVTRALRSAEAARLRINRFEREGGTLDPIVTELCRRYNVAAGELKKRHRGNALSRARKALAFIADHDYHAPHRIIADFLNVGTTAISEMSRQGKAVVGKW